MGDLSDESLLERYRRTKDQKWIAKLFGRYVHMIYGVCLRYTPDIGEAEDMTMEIYEKLCKKALTHQIRQFKPWLYMVSKNHCLEEIRRMTGRRMEVFDPEFVQFKLNVHPDYSEEDSVVKEGQFILLESCLEQLNELQRRSIEMFYLQNKTYVEISEVLENQVSQVRSHLQNGRRNMKKCVERSHK